MRKLLNTLYVMSPDRYLSLDGENIVVSVEREEIGRVPLHNLEAVVTSGYPGVSPALMGKCADQNISLCFMTPSGRFLARVTGPVHGNVLLRREQYRHADDQGKCLDIAKSMIVGKLYNARWVVERACRDYPMRLDVDRLKRVSVEIQESLKKTQNCESTDSLRGLEGEAASRYFSVFDELILQQKEEFYFTTRSKRPPMDAVNAMLSFAYTLLTAMCASALETVGLDPYVGFMHTERPGRKSLALDLTEEFRSVIADRFVLTMINKKVVAPGGFTKREDGAVMMDDNTRKAFVSAWQERKKETIVHPFLKEKVEWGVVPYVQALLLARYIRGDLDLYPPFMWK